MRDLRLCDVLNLGTVVAIGLEVVDFLAALAADVGELLLAFDAEVAAADEVGGDAGGLLVVGLNGLVGLSGRLRIVTRLPIKPRLPICPIGNRAVCSVALLPVLAGAVHFFLDAAFFDEVALFPLNEPADEHVALKDERDGDVGDGLVGALLDFLAVDG